MSSASYHDRPPVVEGMSMVDLGMYSSVQTLPMTDIRPGDTFRCDRLGSQS